MKKPDRMISFRAIVCSGALAIVGSFVSALESLPIGLCRDGRVVAREEGSHPPVGWCEIRHPCSQVVGRVLLKCLVVQVGRLVLTGQMAGVIASSLSVVLL